MSHRVNYTPTKRVRQAVLARDGERCVECGCGTGEGCSKHYAVVQRLDVAHIVPWPAGAPSVANMRLLCRPCNSRERAGPVRELQWLNVEARAAACLSQG